MRSIITSWGKLLFAFTVFRAYIAFSQYMLYYYANIPEETIWFHHRNTGTWYYASLFLVFGRFFLPFLWLLTQPPNETGFDFVWLPAGSSSCTSTISTG
jgi:hypothetical protein